MVVHVLGKIKQNVIESFHLELLHVVSVVSESIIISLPVWPIL
jgi:hypothetical protein